MLSTRSSPHKLAKNKRRKKNQIKKQREATAGEANKTEAARFTALTAGTVGRPDRCCQLMACDDCLLRPSNRALNALQRMGILKKKIYICKSHVCLQICLYTVAQVLVLTNADSWGSGPGLLSGPLSLGCRCRTLRARESLIWLVFGSNHHHRAHPDAFLSISSPWSFFYTLFGSSPHHKPNLLYLEALKEVISQLLNL